MFGGVFIGVDWSLTHTGIARFDGDRWDCVTVTSGTDDGTEAGFLDRVDAIAGKVVSWADPRNGDIIAMEGPSFGSRGAAVDKMFGGWHLTMKSLAEHHSMPWVFAPSSVKKVATGKGNAGKDVVLLATARRVPNAPVSSNHEADAVWLAIAASCIAGHPIVTLPAAHTTGLTRLLRGKK